MAGQIDRDVNKFLIEAALVQNLYGLLPQHVRPGELPPEFDLNFYRTIHHDLAIAFDDPQLVDHYNAFGQNEGRIASPAAHRAGFLATIARDVDTLEIGPFTSPVFRGPKVRYFDVLDRAALIERAKVHHVDPTRCVDIDFVSPTGDLGIVRDTFDCVVSSHCVEHQPDLVTHLLHIQRLLRPGGRYFLIVPDKRYCMDYYLPVSEMPAIEEAYGERRRVHTFKSVYEHVVLTTHNNVILHWRNCHEDENAEPLEKRKRDADQTFAGANGGYVDVHAWQFTPASFRSVMSQIISKHGLNLTVERVYQTVYGRNEFTAVISRP